MPSLTRLNVVLFVARGCAFGELGVGDELPVTTYARTRVLLLVQDLHVRVVDAATGELLRELVLDPTKRYQGTGRPPEPPPKEKWPGPTKRGSGLFRSLETSHS